MKKINVALIGCGFFGKQLAAAFYKTGANLIGVTDIDLSLAIELAEKFSAQVYEDSETLISKTQPDLAIIATFNYAHIAPATTALNHNCHLFIEVPFSLNPNDCQSILSLAQEKNKTVFIGHLLRTLPGVLKAKEFIENDVLGKITVARATRQRWIDSSFDKSWWKNDIKLTGGKLFNEIHELDLLCWLLGDISSVYAQSTNRAHPENRENHDIIQLLLQFKNGIFASLEMGTAYRLHEWGISIHGELGALVINFYNSTMTLTLSNGTRQQFNLYDEFEADLSLREHGKSIQKYNQINTLAPLWLSRATEIEAENVITNLTTKTQHSVLADQTLSAVQVAYAATLSIQQKKQINVD